MNLILKHGEKLFKKELNKVDECIKMTEQMINTNLHAYQKIMLKKILSDYTPTDYNSNNEQYCIYGDDFKVNIIPQNVVNKCCLNISDFDENQVLETKINIDFSKDELSQFINLLQTMKKKMK
jgi:hypothetical protein